MAGPFPVFVVEDSHHMQSALRELVESVGPFQIVETAGSESRATEWLIQHNAWEIAIVDLMLPDGSGFPIVQRCRRERPEGNVVVLSEFASPAVKDRCRALGANAAFLKSEMKHFIQYLEALGAPH